MDKPKNYLTGREYTGENSLVLTLAGAGYESSEWLTYLQAQECGGSVKKGEKGVRIVKVLEDEDTKNKSVRFYTVFNSEQCENLDADLKLTPEQYEIYKTLKKDGTEMTRKQLAKTSSLL